jgi:DNA polymerase
MLNRRTAEALGIGPVWRLRQPQEEAVDPVLLAESVPAPVRTAPEPLPLSRVLETLPGAPAQAGPAPVVPPVRPLPDGAYAQMGWDELAAGVRECRQCRLCTQRQQAVFGVGDIHADWLFVGEGPGADEDEQGEPFVGRAGKLLDQMLMSLGLARGNGVYIANVVKCRPPNNRTPEADETAACFPWLSRQIELIAPRLIVALGRPAAQTLLGQEVRIGAARGKLHHYGEIPLVVTYHPAYLLRNPADKAKSWADLCFARRILKEEKTEL